MKQLSIFIFNFKDNILQYSDCQLMNNYDQIKYFEKIDGNVNGYHQLNLIGKSIAYERHD